jgi:hypothetical protein
MNPLNMMNDFFRPMKTEKIVDAFNKALYRHKFDNISVLEVEDNLDGTISVIFKEADGDELFTLWGFDIDEGAFVLVTDLDEISEVDDIDVDNADDLIEIDLDTFRPALVKKGMHTYINLTDLHWTTPSMFNTIFTVDDIENEEDEYPISDYVFEEAFRRKKYAIRGGKKVKVAIKRKRPLKRMKAATKRKLSKALRKASKKSSTKRARARSLKVRKRTMR